MNEPTRVFLVRHGRTAWNAEQRLQGQLDVALDAMGSWQAAQLARALADEQLAAIYSSDLRRARDTAQALADLQGLVPVTDAALRERGFGRLEGLSYAEIETAWPEDARRWRLREADYRPGGGESLRDFFERSVAAVTRLAAPHAGSAIAVFTHGGVLDSLYRAAAGVELGAARSWQLGNATINRLLYTGERFVIVGWDDHAHLEPPAAAP